MKEYFAHPAQEDEGSSIKADCNLLEYVAGHRQERNERPYSETNE